MRKLSYMLIGLGAALLVGALLLFGWSAWDASRAEESAHEILEQVAPLAGSDEAEAAGRDMATVSVDGQTYVGYLSLPTLGLELPVMSTWSEDQLRECPCRYYGTAQDGNLVIAGSNYASHFGRLAELGVGDEVVFVGMDGLARTYTVAEVSQLASDDTEAMTSSGYALTLFTRSYDGSSLVVVRCDAA